MLNQAASFSYLILLVFALEWANVATLRSYVVLDQLGKPLALKSYEKDNNGRARRVFLKFGDPDDLFRADTYDESPTESPEPSHNDTDGGGGDDGGQHEEPDRARRCWVCSSVPPDFFPEDRLPELTSAAKEVLDNPDVRRECHRYITMDQRGTSGRYGTLVRMRKGEGCLLVSRYSDAHPLLRAVVVRDKEEAAALQNFGPTYMVNFCVCRSNECNLEWCQMASPAVAMASVRNPLIVAAVLFNSLVFSKLLFPQLRELGGYFAHVVYSANGFFFNLVWG